LGSISLEKAGKNDITNPRHQELFPAEENEFCKHPGNKKRFVQKLKKDLVRP
jgi:hypothetical protein